jgi:predicted small secreted protein
MFRRMIVSMVALPVALLAATLTACGGGSDDDAPSNTGKVTRTFSFEATATGSETIEKVNAGMDISEEGRKVEEGAANPWRHEVTTTDFPEGMIPQILVQNLISGGGSTVTCRILMDGKEIANETGEGIVECRVTDLPS